MRSHPIPPGMTLPRSLTLLCVMVVGLTGSGARAQALEGSGALQPSRELGVVTQVLRHSPRELSVILEFPPAQLDTARVEESVFHVPHQEGWFLSEEPGVPLNLERTFYAALPPGGEYDAEWTVEEETSHTELNLPVTMALGSGDSYTLEGVRTPADAQRAAEPPARPWESWTGSAWPEQFVQIRDAAWARYQRVLPIVVRRFRIQGDGEVRELRRLGLTIRFEEGSPARAGRRQVPPRGAGLRLEVLNPAEGDGWLAAPQPRRTLGETHIFSLTPNPWLRVKVSKRGIFRITREDATAAGFPVDEADLSSIRLFAGSQLPVPDHVNVDDLPVRMDECAILVEDLGEPGVWDSDDSVVFLGNGPDGWLNDYASENRGFERHTSHPSSSYGVYWLTWGGAFEGDPKRMEVRSVDPGGLAPRAVGETRLHIERNSFYDPRPKDANATWEKFWFQEAFDNPSNVERSVLFDTRDVVEGEQARIRARYFGASWNSGASLPDHILVAGLNGVDVDSVAWESLDPQDIEKTLVALRGDEPNRWHYVPLFMEDPVNPSRTDRIYLAWLEVDYPRRLIAVDDSLEFFGPTGELPLVFEVSGFSSSSEPVAMNATDPWNPYILPGETSEGGGSSQSIIFADEPAQDFPPHYVVLDPSRAARPADMEVVSRQGNWLRDRQGVADAIFIVHPSLLEAAEELAAYRRDNYPDIPDGVVLIVTTDQIYDEFSWGLVDVTAIRNFLEYAYDRWSDGGARRPAYVLFFGDPYYDQRNYLREGGVLLVPNYQDYYSQGFRLSIYNPQFSSDDYMTLVDGNDDLIDISWGRFPVENLSQARDLVRKSIDYERSPPLTRWKTRFADLADDFCQGSAVEGLANVHTKQAEQLMDEAVPPCIHPDRLYLVEYGTTCPTPTKPQATADLIDLINDGVLVVNYTGHGSEGQLSDEKLFETSRVQSLANEGKPFLFVNASCSVGKHDIPGVGLGESMLRLSGRGAMWVFAASALASSFSNAELNRFLFQQTMPGLRPAAVLPMGLGVRLAKAAQIEQANSRRYVLLGDPLARLAVPRQEILLTIDSGQGVGADADTLLRGARTRMTGTVQDILGNVLTDFDGEVDLRLYDSELKKEPCNVRGCVAYNLLGAPVFRGTLPVEAGRFTMDFVVPKSLLLGDRGFAKIFAYASDGSRDALGCRAELTIPADVVITSPDAEGPEITLELASGDSLAEPGDELLITLADSSGINITGLRGALSVVLRYNDNLGRPVLVEDLASRVAFTGDPTRAEVTVPVSSSLPTGRTYTVEVTAADNLDNQSRASLVMRLTAPGDVALSLGRVFNFPNPAETATRFFLEVNREVDVEISIYSATGRRIQRLDWMRRDPQEVFRTGLFWDGRDADGDALGNGVYFYKVRVRDPESGEVITRTEKLAVLR